MASSAWRAPAALRGRRLLTPAAPLQRLVAGPPPRPCGPQARRLAMAQQDEGADYKNPNAVASNPDPTAMGASESEGLWSRFVRWTQRNTGYPDKVDFCNCGADIGYTIPMPELIKREGIEVGSLDYRQQLYGAALYWHLAVVPGEKIRYADPDMMRGKDVLEVACARGGGARYLAEVAGPQSYVATDYLESNLEICRTRHSPLENLEFRLADACELGDHFPAASFDFVMCVQAATHFQDVRKFVFGASHVLRPGGRILICDSFQRDKLQALLDAAEEFGLIADATVDMSRAVHAVGLCRIPSGLSYLRLVLKKPPQP